jgi:hypothetical protein
MFCYVPHRQAAHPAETVMVERFQFGSFNAQLSLPQSAILVVPYYWMIHSSTV